MSALSLLVERPSVDVVIVRADVVLMGGLQYLDCPLCNSQEQRRDECSEELYMERPFVVNEAQFYCFRCGAKGVIAEDTA